MQVFSLEEFAARRRRSQEELEAAILPVAEDAVLSLGDGLADWATVLLEVVDDAFFEAYGQEGGSGSPRGFTKFHNDVEKSLEETSPDSEPVLIATWLATAILNAATMSAAAADPDFIVMEWVTMDDGDVRATHRDVEGQQRPPGEMFVVGGEEMPYPGYPGVSPSLWMNCRCALRPASPDEASFHMETGAMENEGEVMAEENEQVAEAVPWHGVLAPEGKWSGDGRMFAENALSWRDLPVPLTWQKASSEGHGGSVVVGRIDQIVRVNGEMRGTGVMLSNAESSEVQGMIDEFGKFGVSVDADDAEFEFDDASGQITFTKARIAAASVVAIPAFAEAYVALGPAPEGFLDGESTEEADEKEAVEYSEREGVAAAAVSLVASADSIKAPAAWFQNPGLDKPTHLTVTEEGRVFGHIAEWSQCHIGYDGVCVNPPFSKANYGYFATGSVLLDNGEMARTGIISVGGGHANHNLRWRAAIEHYDSTSAAVADVAVGEDEFGIWCSGWVRPGTTDEQIVALRASKVSGDWREVVQNSGELELVGALAVNIPGFPVKVAASNGRQVTLVAAGIVDQPTEKIDPVLVDAFADAVARAIESRKERQERMAALAARIK